MKIRKEFEFTVAAADLLPVLQKRIGADTEAKVVNEALRLLDYATADTIEGSRVVYQEPDGKGGYVETVITPRK